MPAQKSSLKSNRKKISGRCTCISSFRAAPALCQWYDEKSFEMVLWISVFFGSVAPELFLAAMFLHLWGRQDDCICPGDSGDAIFHSFYPFGAKDSGAGKSRCRGRGLPIGINGIPILWRGTSVLGIGRKSEVRKPGLKFLCFQSGFLKKWRNRDCFFCKIIGKV